MKRILFLFLILFLEIPAGSWAQKPPELRLGDAAQPLRMELDLTILAEDPAFSGIADIDLKFQRPASVLWINGTELAIQEASLQIGGETIKPRVLQSQENFLGFVFDHPVGPGDARLHLAFQGSLNAIENTGMFRQKDREDWYVFTDFEPIDSRRAFPCFDEPAYKTPWKITLHVKKENKAFSNTPIESETEEPAGMKRIVFRETRPLPSYLISIAVGPFDVVEAGTAGKNKIPLRIITPRGKGSQAGYAAEITAPLLALMEEYFGTPHPYEKLDQIAIPQFGGAMENAGLITYSQRLLLAKPEDQSIRWKRSISLTMAHEIAHMWVGDWVTMNWYDDLWLNEGFANWLGSKIIAKWKPEWELESDIVKSRSDAMTSDSLITARAIRQPIKTDHDMQNAFDNITYAKGEAVIEMFEAWVGKEKFQNAVRRYLSEHAWGSATAADFLSALGKDTGTEVAAAFNTFLDRPGVPMISVQLTCGQDRKPNLILTQERYLPIGSAGKAEQIWQIPVCVRYEDAAGAKNSCKLMTKAREEMSLETAVCPGWVLANAGETGYYRSLYEENLLQTLLQDGQTTIPERVGLFGDVWALANNGRVPASDVLALIPKLLQDPDPHLLSITAEFVNAIGNHLVMDQDRPSYREFIRGNYSIKARELGLSSKPEEPMSVVMLRPVLSEHVASDGKDAQLANEAVLLSMRWLEDRTAISPEMVKIVLAIAARHGDQSMLNRFLQAAKKSEDRAERFNLMGALGSFTDPELEKAALSLIVGDDFDPRESIYIFRAAVIEPDTRLVAYQFVKDNFDMLTKKLPQLTMARMPLYLNEACGEQDRKDLETFFGKRIGQFRGGPRNLQESLEKIDLCIALRNAQGPSVSRFLRSR